ncbi:MAG: glycosyltransferase [Candidatus Levybacteria bacterium]|nr:glycosyltransferase [Candidatus Levybacteria bacterium]
MEKKPVVSIIIVHYQVKKQLFNCLQSIYEKKSKYHFEIIVIDNDENPYIEKYLVKKFPRVKYIKNEINNGYSGGNNLGALSSKGEFIFFLNPDTLFKNNVLDQLLIKMMTYKYIGIVAPLLFKENGKPFILQGSKELTPLRAIFSLSFIYKLFPNNNIANEFWLKKWNKKEHKEVEVVPGTAFMIRKNIFKKIGGFDENYFLYFEENDICKRVIDLGSKIYMISDAHVIHFWGESTKKSTKNIKAIFEKSRFYYFNKFYGLPKAFLVEFMLIFSKEILFLIAILFLAGWLRLHEIERYFPFLGDFAWFYISARDLLIDGIFPFVGIASSHPWIHQGAFWTYLLAPALAMGNFNPIAGGYLSGSIGILTVLILYICTKNMFDRRIAIFTSAFFATSPLVVFHSRLPYHTVPIPLFVILYFYSLNKWVKGNIYYFPLSLFFLVVLYNFELATSVFSLLIICLLGYGIYIKAIWIKKLWTKKIISFSIIAVLIPLLPMLFYDFYHGFSQTLLFLIWIGYRFLLVLGYPSLHPEIKTITFSSMIYFIKNNIQNYYYVSSWIFAFFLGIISISICGILFIKNKTLTYAILFLGILIPGIIIFFSRVPSEAYLPMFFPQLAICIGIAFSYLYKYSPNYSWIIVVFFIFLIISNSVNIISKNFLTKNENKFYKKIVAAQEIISLAEGKEYIILGGGINGKFESFIMPYKYLTWFLGYSENKKAKIKIEVSEDEMGIYLKKYD